MKRFFFLFLFLILAIGISPAANETCDVNSETCPITNIGGNQTVQFQESTVNANDTICIAYFYGVGCPHCANTEPFINELEQKYSGKVHVEKLEVYHNLKNYELYNSFCSVQSIPVNERGIPLVAIGDEFYMGESQIKEKTELKIQEMLSTGDRTCPLEGEMGCHLIEQGNNTNQIIPGLKDKLTLPVVLISGLVDGVNPCAFAVLLFLLTFLLEVSSSKKRMIKAGIAYVIGVYITYFLAGLGLLVAIQFTGVSSIIVKIAAVLAIIAGLINIKDYFWYGKGFSLKIPESRKSTIENWVRKANVPAALVLGFLVAMFELPCTGGIYLAILAMIANTATQTQAITYLLLYNLMFVIPLVAIMILVVTGMKAEHVESWRNAKKNVMKLVMGLLLLGLGVALLLGIF